VFRLLLLPIRLPLKTAGLALRLAGLRNAIVLAIGIAIGLLIAPVTGAETRRRLKELMDERRTMGADGPSVRQASEPLGV
jgi:hypothetical protein